jgi:hypothetical protein
MMFADDIVVYAANRDAVQSAVNFIKNWAQDVRLSINIEKTKAMKFRKGGRLARDDVILIDGVVIEFVQSFTYLGVTIPSNGKSFHEHISSRVTAALKCAYGDVKNPSRLSLSTAIKLFDLKISPIATYAIPIIWKYLSVTDLFTLDRVKTMFLKRVLCVARNSKNRLVYLLAGCSSLIEKLQKTFGLESTPAYLNFMTAREVRSMEVDNEFYLTPALLDRSWQSPLYSSRHIFTRYSIHGFHHIICQRRNFHLADSECLCQFCNLPCSQYHVLSCGQLSMSLRAIASHEPAF